MCLWVQRSRGAVPRGALGAPGALGWPVMPKRVREDDQLDKILSLGKQSYASGRAIQHLLCSLRGDPTPLYT